MPVLAQKQGGDLGLSMEQGLPGAGGPVLALQPISREAPHPSVSPQHWQRPWGTVAVLFVFKLEVFLKYDLFSSPCSLFFIRVTYTGRSFSSKPSIRAPASPCPGAHRRPGSRLEGEPACLPSARAQATDAPGPWGRGVRRGWRVGLGPKSCWAPRRAQRPLGRSRAGAQAGS